MLFLITLAILLLQTADCIILNCRINGFYKTIQVSIFGDLLPKVFTKKLLTSISTEVSKLSELKVKCLKEENLLGKSIDDGCEIDFMLSDEQVYEIQSENQMMTSSEVFRKIQSDVNLLNGKMATVESDNAALVAKVATVESDNAALKESNAALVAKVATVESDNAALNESTNSLHFVNAERDICQVIDDVYASILKEMQKSGHFQNIQTLSSLLSGKTSKNDQEKRLLDEEIIAALSSLAKKQLHSHKQAAYYWWALSGVKQRRNFEQHYNSGRNAEQAQEVLSSYLKYWRPTKQSAGKKVWPSSSTQTAQFKEIMEILIPIVCSPNSRI